MGITSAMTWAFTDPNGMGDDIYVDKYSPLKIICTSENYVNLGFMERTKKTHMENPKLDPSSGSIIQI